MNLAQIFTDLVFFSFAAILVGSALMTIISRNPVRSALFLVLAFFAATGLWILLEVEFLGLILILVYVGAVMTLFLFVVMTLNIDVEEQRSSFVRYLPFAIVIVAMLVILMVYVISPGHLNPSELTTTGGQPVNYSNTTELGMVLYTDYAYPFELAGILLLVAIIAAISLTFHGKGNNKTQNPDQQILIRREDRIRMVKMQGDKK